MEERDSPLQIVLPSMDERICALLNLGIYLETCDINSTNEYLYGNGVDGDRKVRNALNTVLRDPKFTKLGLGKIGTHSIRKGAATYGSRCGLSKNFIEHRGSWRNGRKQVDTYIDVFRPFPDAATAACLCGHNGASSYVINKNATWLNNQSIVKIVHTLRIF